MSDLQWHSRSFQTDLIKLIAAESVQFDVFVTTSDGLQNGTMTISSAMVLNFIRRFAMMTVGLIDQVVGLEIGSGPDTDKFDQFGLPLMKRKHVRAPLIKEFRANIEYRVVDFVENHHITIPGLGIFISK